MNTFMIVKIDILINELPCFEKCKRFLAKAVSFSRKIAQSQQAYKHLQITIQHAEQEQERPFAYKVACTLKLRNVNN